MIKKKFKNFHIDSKKNIELIIFLYSLCPKQNNNS